jgi:4,5-DOPA dioxygenase extradiol
LADAGLSAATDNSRGLDHGAWVPLLLAWPDADIPVVQLSVQSQLGPGHHLEVGRAIAPLVDEGVLILASGSYTHDLSSWRGQAGMTEPEWVTDFADWFDAALTEGRTCDLLAYRRLAPNAQRNHPTEEHLLPLFVALGAAGPNAFAERLHASNTYGVLRMDAYAFGAEATQPS